MIYIVLGSIIFIYLAVAFYTQYKFGKVVKRKNAIAIGLSCLPVLIIAVLSYFTNKFLGTEFTVESSGVQLKDEEITKQELLPSVGNIIDPDENLPMQ